MRFGKRANKRAKYNPRRFWLQADDNVPTMRGRGLAWYLREDQVWCAGLDFAHGRNRQANKLGSLESASWPHSQADRLRWSRGNEDRQAQREDGPRQ